jgi:hypothetical protein
MKRTLNTLLILSAEPPGVDTTVDWLRDLCTSAMDAVEGNCNEKGLSMDGIFDWGDTKSSQFNPIQAEANRTIAASHPII